MVSSARAPNSRINTNTAGNMYAGEGRGYSGFIITCEGDLTMLHAPFDVCSNQQIRYVARGYHDRCKDLEIRVQLHPEARTGR